MQTHILMVGHNPGLEDLIFDLVPDDGSSPARDQVGNQISDCHRWPRWTLAIDDWADITEKCGTLDRFTRPRDLDPELGLITTRPICPVRFRN